MAKLAPSIGRMRHRIRILRRVTTRDPLGQQVDEWQLIHGNIPAAIHDTGGTETPRGGNQIQAERRTVLEIRYLLGVKANHRVETDDGRLLHIVAVIDASGMKKHLRLECIDAGEVPPDAQ